MTKTKHAYTTVINISGEKKAFSFLPPHGITMNAWQSITYIGELYDRLIPSWPYHTDPDRPPNPMKIKSVKKAEQDGVLMVIRSNASIKHAVLSARFQKLSGLGTVDHRHLNTYE